MSMLFKCFNCGVGLEPPLHNINYCNDCWQGHIIILHDKLIADSLHWENNLLTIKEELHKTRALISEIRKEAERCGFGIGSNVKEEVNCSRETNKVDNREGANLSTEGESGD